MHVATVVHMLKRLGNVDQDVTDVLLQHRISTRDEDLEVRELTILHRQKVVSLDLSVLDIADDAIVIADLGENLAALDEAFLGFGVLSQSRMQSADGNRMFVRIGRQPDVGHATAVDDLLQVVIPKMPGLAPLGIFGA